MTSPRSAWWRDPRAQDLALFAVGVTARILAQIPLGTFDRPEPWEPHYIAASVARGDGFAIEHNGTTFRALSAPLYPLVLAALYGALGVGPAAPLLLNAVLGGALAVVVRHVAGRLLTPPLDLVAGGVAALYVPLLIFAGKIHGLNADVLLVALSILVAMRVVDGTGRPVLELGIVGGADMLQRPTIVPILVLGAVLALAKRRRRVAAAGTFGLAVLLASAISLPWLIRDQIELGRPILSSTFWEVAWRGNNPYATGSGSAADGRPILEADPELRDATYGKPELVQDRLFEEATLRFVTARPMHAARLTIAKLAQFWWFGPSVGSTYPARWLWLYAAAYLAALLLAIVGAIAVLRRGERMNLTLVLLAMLIVSVAQGLTYVEGRHRWQVEPILLILTVAGADIAVRRAQQAIVHRNAI